MKKILATLILTASFAAPSVAFAIDVNVYEKQLDLVGRLKNGTIQADVDRVQTYLESDAAGKPVWKVNLEKSRANMRAVRSHVVCVLTPEKCGNEGKKN